MSTSIHFVILIHLFKWSVSTATNEVNTTDFYRAALEETVEDSGACGGVHIEKQFTLQSPRYPEKYPGNLDCPYLLKGPHCPTYYQFEFLDFALENSEGCVKDRFVVKNQDVLCGNKNKTKSYFAENGSLHLRFRTDGEGSERGYFIRVTRMACEVEGNLEFATEEDATEVLTESTTYESIQTTLVPPIESRLYLPPIMQKNQHCCGTIYNSKTFRITSPNYPYSLNKKTECIFEIHKTNNNICRLRLNFEFFWLGYTNRNNCPHGFLEIDGKYICGCNSDLRLSTTFGNSNAKVLKFKTDGYYQSYHTGFVIEVIQDECPKKYSPEGFTTDNTSSYEIYNDQINRVAWPTDNQNLIEKLQLINEKTEILDDDGVFLKSKPKVVKSFYYFAAPEYNDFPPLQVNREKTTYMDISSINTVLTNSEYYQCLNWNQIQYNILSGKHGNSLQCSRSDESSMSTEVDHRNCVDLSYINGYFRSPGYPCYYPGNINVCYRLRKQPGYCAIRIFVHDFQIESSVNCVKDYFSLANGEKHCGNSLDKASWTIDVRDKDYEDMIFVTDGYYCGRGFSGVYQQIACQDDFPIHPVDTTTTPIIPTRPVHDYCNQIIKEKSFTMVLDKDHRTCTFNIRRSEQDVCKINFYFEKFDLVCTVESLVIDGTMYCGHLTGRVVKVNVNRGSLDIVYRSSLENKYDDLRFRIRGEQVSDDCLFLETPDVQRLLQLKTFESTSDKSTSTTTNSLQQDSKYLVAFVNRQLKDICGIVTNSTEKELPSSFCDILTNNHNATKCMPLRKEMLIDVPHESKKLGIELLDGKKIDNGIEELEIHEIDCDNLRI